MDAGTSREPLAILLAALVVSPSPLFATFVPWSSSSGSNSVVAWSGGGSDDGLWGDPVVVGTTFLFFPAELRAISSNGNPSTVDSMLRFDLDLLFPGFVSFTEVAVFEYGSYAILANGEVSAAGRITVIDRDRPSISYTDVLHTSEPMPLANSLPDPGVSGTWEGAMDVHLPFPFPESVRHLTVSVDARMAATSALASGGDPGGTAFINNQASPAAVVIALILNPEPSTLALVIFSTPIVLRRRVRPLSH